MPLDGGAGKAELVVAEAFALLPRPDTQSPAPSEGRGFF